MKKLLLKIDRSTIRKNPRFGETYKYLDKKTLEKEVRLEKRGLSIIKKEYIDGKLSSEVAYFGPPESQPLWKEEKSTITLETLEEEYEPEYLYTYIVPDNYHTYDEVEFESIYEALASMNKSLVRQ